MEIFDKLSSVDGQLKDNLKNLEEERRNQEYAQRKEEQRRKEEERNKRREAKKEKLKIILEDSTEGIDEPQWYIITYEHSKGWRQVGCDYGAPFPNGTGKFKLLMTEREQRVAEATGKLKQYALMQAPGQCDITRIETSKVNHEMTEEEKLKIEAIRKKVEIIKGSKETEVECIIDLYDEEFGHIPVNTSLKYALLSSLSIENGNVADMNKQETKTNLSAKQKSKITFGSIKRAIGRVFNKGER